MLGWNLFLNRYVIGAALIAALLFGGYKLLENRWAWKDKAKTAEKVIEKTQEVQKDVEEARDRVEGLTPEQLAEYFRTGRLPERRP